MDAFDETRARAIREQLVAHAAEARPPRRRAFVAVALVLSGALGGAAVSAGAFAATGNSPTAVPADAAALAPAGQPEPDLPPAVDAPPGVPPGSNLTVLLDAPITRVYDGPLQLDLTERPAAATHVRATVTATTAGTVSWGTDADGNNPSSAWPDDDVAAGRAESSYDFPLDDSVTTFFLSPTGAAGTVTLQFVLLVPTRLGVNERGETFGVSGSAEGEPDLVLVVGEDAAGAEVEGYARASDLSASSPQHPGLPSSPEEALAWQEEIAEQYPDGWTVPVFASDGVTQLGEHRIGG